MKPKLPGIFLVMVGALWFSGGSMLIKSLGPDVPVTWVAFIRNLVSIPFMFAAMKYKGYAFSSDYWFRLILRGTFGCLAMGTFFWCLPRLPLATVLLLHCTAPLFAALWGTLFMGEELDGWSIGFIFLAFIGVYVTLRPGSADVSLAHYVALASGLFSSMAFAAIKSLSKTEVPIRIIFYFCVLGTIVFGIPALQTNFWPAPVQWGKMVGVGLFTTVGQLFLTWGISSAPVSKASIGSLGRIVFNIAGGWLIWNEIPDGLTWLGCAFIVGGILGLASNLKRRLLVTSGP